MSSRLGLVPTQPHMQRVPGALSPGIKRPRREDDHQSPTSDKVKKMRIYLYTSTPPYVFMAQCLISYTHDQAFGTRMGRYARWTNEW
jgi:hypothetical protein